MPRTGEIDVEGSLIRSAVLRNAIVARRVTLIANIARRNSGLSAIRLSVMPTKSRIRVGRSHETAHPCDPQAPHCQKNTRHAELQARAVHFDALRPRTRNSAIPSKVTNAATIRDENWSVRARWGPVSRLSGTNEAKAHNWSPAHHHGGPGRSVLPADGVSTSVVSVESFVSSLTATVIEVDMPYPVPSGSISWMIGPPKLEARYSGSNIGKLGTRVHTVEDHTKHVHELQVGIERRGARRWQLYGGHRRKPFVNLFLGPSRRISVEKSVRVRPVVCRYDHDLVAFELTEECQDRRVGTLDLVDVCILTELDYLRRHGKEVDQLSTQVVVHAWFALGIEEQRGMRQSEVEVGESWAISCLGRPRVPVSQLINSLPIERSGRVARGWME